MGSLSTYLRVEKELLMSATGGRTSFIDDGVLAVRALRFTSAAFDLDETDGARLREPLRDRFLVPPDRALADNNVIGGFFVVVCCC